MKVIELIKKLNEIGYDENTELTFSCFDRVTGENCEISFYEIAYGVDLTGEPYKNDVIDISVDVDSCTRYLGLKKEQAVEDVVDEMQDVLNKYVRKIIF